jgi:uncharacterized LabA/DUF88 family protein
MAQLIPFIADLTRAMTFVDGENFAIRFGNLLKTKNLKPGSRINCYLPGVAVWCREFNNAQGGANVLRKHYYTSVQGSDADIQSVAEQLKAAGIEAPRVFRKDKQRGSKRVDISLATDMLFHATQDHYEVAVLIAGDEDYVPLVRAVQNQGKLVHVWFIHDGLSPALKHTADYFVDLEPTMLLGAMAA